jgi:hypothetical protein
VLVDGRVCTPATTGAGVKATTGAGVEPVGVAAATVGVAVAAAAADGATVAADGAGAVVDATAAVGRVPAHGALGMFTMNSHGGNADTVGALHADEMNVSLINVTLPVLASALPSTVTPLWSVMDVSAMIVPTKDVPDPKFAELVTCQKTLHGLAPLMRRTAAADDAVMSEDVAWKIQTEFGSPWPFSVTVPVKSRMKPPEL